MGNYLLVMDLDDPFHKVSMEFFDEMSVPERLNGETGTHIYHVRILTEMILRQLVEDGTGLSDEEIRAVAIASSLHDIGKVCIPEELLKSPVRLSAEEYDSVKQHTEIGEFMIAEAQTDEVDPMIIQYAMEIAHSHHERVDGSGYPEGLLGEKIPVYIQAVALADTYDALMSRQHFKQAFSRDVAIQMISCGMCGRFDEKLVKTLTQVLSKNVYEELREQIQQSRSVLSDSDAELPRMILCVGNTDYVTREFLDRTFPESKIVVVGNRKLKNTARIKSFSITKSSVKSLFETYDFDAVVYFSRELTYCSHEGSETRYLQQVLRRASEIGQRKKFIYLSALNSAQDEQSAEAIICSSKEKMCQAYASTTTLEMKIIRIPSLYCSTCEKDFLFYAFEQMRRGRGVELNERPENPLCFMAMHDLSNLLIRLFENWSSGSGILSVGESFGLTFADFSKALTKLKDCNIVFTEEAVEKHIIENNQFLKEYYGWIALVSVLEELPEQYESYLQKFQPKERTWKDKLRGFLRRHRLSLGVFELLLLFIVTEFLINLTDSAVLFSIVDFRMAYVVIMAQTHGIYFGLASAALSSAAWFAAKILSGANWMTIFYEPTNWLAFVYFFLVGGVCGYEKLRNEDRLRIDLEEKHLLEEKLIFTREIYEDTYQEKRDLKKQIIGSKDSFGKIFDIARKLDTVELNLLYLRTVEAFETILENKSITIYSVNEKSAYGRLEVASRSILNRVERSIPLDRFTSLIEETENGEIWRNIQLEPDFPMFAAGIYRDGKLVLLIFLWEAELEQRTLYYANLFKILKDLVQMSLLRALEYNQAIYEKKFIPGTGILNSETFETLLSTLQKMSSQKRSNYILLEIDNRHYSLEETEMMLNRKIRQNDRLGLTKSGKLCLVLVQASEEDLEYVLPRFDDLDITVSVIR